MEVGFAMFSYSSVKWDCLCYFGHPNGDFMITFTCQIIIQQANLFWEKTVSSQTSSTTTGFALLGLKTNTDFEPNEGRSLELTLKMQSECGR